jgi:hypothetical protein
MKPTQATSWITEARFEPYLAEADGNHERAVALYVWNARVSAAMFETLHHVEVALRNVIDAQFDLVVASAPVSSTWLCDPTILNEASRTRVEETAARIRREGHLATRARVVAGLAFGFWRALFDKRYDRIVERAITVARNETARLVRSQPLTLGTGRSTEPAPSGEAPSTEPGPDSGGPEGCGDLAGE